MGTPAQTMVGRAFLLAQHLHRDQVRKGTSVAYISHLLAVTSLVLEDGGSDVAAAAALLHDAAEDQGGRDTLALIAEECGQQVAYVVEECSDALLPAGAAKPAWQERKEAFIDGLPNKTYDGLLVIAADKLHNARATLVDLEISGASVWERFKTGQEGFIWYHDQLSEHLHDRLPHSRSLHALRSTMDRIRELSAGAETP